MSKSSVLSSFLGFGGLVLLAAAAGRPADQQKFFGKWTLDVSRSKLPHENDSVQSLQWRSYAQEGDRVRVSWGSTQGQLGTYTSKCDGSIEFWSNVRIQCRQARVNTIDGRQFDSGDPKHTYYRREVSGDGKTMTITWFEDAKRRKALEQWVYAKAE